MQGRTRTEEAALAALDHYVEAAVLLSEAWQRVLDTGYPKCLPSFDEFVAELQEWQDAVNMAPTQTGEDQ